MSEDWAKTYLDMIDECFEQESKLNDWERDFLDSLQGRLEGGRELTVKQIDRLEEVVRKVGR